ncbi:MAG: 4-(cytidine 5'-diphospho)-2-C-methyl-D-erythritol kinase [Oscillospiraceae bacterium]|nr:4-(cytidine 5'-diphospho)-2-C-methyl-D-erythritol kinase [Oscillospiraceae bacterium]
MIIKTKAYAKLNLTLDVLGRRGDGYHNLKMITQTVGLCDHITIELTGEAGFSARCDHPFVPCDERNLAARAMRLFLEQPSARAPERGIAGGVVDITKRVPVCSGLGGGSSDAAAVLTALNDAFGRPLDMPALLELAAAIGSDTPFFMLGGARLVQGRGEILTPLPSLPPCALLIVKPPVPLSTADVFGWYSGTRARGDGRRPDTGGFIDALQKADLTGAARRVFNLLEDVAARRVREISELHARLISAGALGASMTGTGSAVFGVFPDERAASLAAAGFGRSCETFVTGPLPAL